MSESQKNKFKAKTLESREQVLERLLRELVWHADNVRTIIMRDRQDMNFEYAADLLDTGHIQDFLAKKTRERVENEK